MAGRSDGQFGLKRVAVRLGGLAGGYHDIDHLLCTLGSIGYRWAEL